MKITKITFLIAVTISIIALFSGCNKHNKSEFIDNTTGEQQEIRIIRFDKELFQKPDPDTETFLKNLQAKYPEMFAASLDDKEYLGMIEKFISDNYLLDAQNTVQRNYPDLTFLEKDLTSAFANLQKQHKDTQLPRRLFSMIFGPAEFSYVFDNRCYTNGDYATIALDAYSYPQIEKNPYYTQMPQYMQQTLNKNYIAPDFMRMYLKNVTYKNTPSSQMNPDCTLLDYIVEEGKYSYIVSRILPKHTESEVLRYTDEQLKWCNENEKLIWGYITEQHLLYEKDRSKFMSLTAEGPSSRPLGDSPSRVGNYIGYNIVKQFMNNNKISFDSLMNLNDSQLILQKSKYKPSK